MTSTLADQYPLCIDSRLRGNDMALALVLALALTLALIDSRLRGNDSGGMQE